MKSTRREIVMFAGGSAVGALFTPAPWRLVMDAARLSENWPGIPRPARGEVRNRYTHCTLCTAGCAVRARCVGDQPVALAGVAGHPRTRGALCAFGLAGHQLPYHPARVRRGPVAQAAEAVARAVARSGSAEYVVTLDPCPGRTASWTYRRAMAALRNGRYLAPAQTAAVDLSRARTVLSLGVPVLDGWGTPGNVMAARPGFRLIQVEAVESRTASLADLWLRIRPGSEDVLARALAGEVAPGVAASATGISETQLAAVAAELRDNGPLLVLGTARIASTGGTLVERREAPVPAEWRNAAAVTSLDALPDGSVRVLLVDETEAAQYLPWPLIARKLVADDPVVVTFTSSPEGYARHAGYVLPVGVYPEVASDIPPAVDSPIATFGLSVPLVAAPKGMVKPEEFVAAAAGLALGNPLRQRADAIHQSGRGTLFTYADARQAPVTDVSSDDFWKALQSGACWTDAPEPAGGTRAVVSAAGPAAKSAGPAAAEEPDLPLTVVLEARELPAAPLLSKLYGESNLRLGARRVALHPSQGLPDGSRAVLQTALGKCAVEVLWDAGVPPGAVRVTAWPALLDFCAAGARARVVAA